MIAANSDDANGSEDKSDEEISDEEPRNEIHHTIPSALARAEYPLTEDPESGECE